MVRTRRKDFPTLWIACWVDLAVLLALVPAAMAQLPVVRVDFPGAAGEVPITKWQLLGPFRFEERDMEGPGVERRPVGLNRDYLRDFGLDESSVDASSFLLARIPERAAAVEKQFDNRAVQTQAKTNILQIAALEPPLDYAVTYAAVNIESPRDQDVVIAAGSDDGMQVWLNHELLYADANTAGPNAKKFGHLIGASLKKGDNFFLAKVCKLTGDWRLIVTLYPQEQALTLARENAINPILRTSIVEAGEALELRGDLLPRSKTAHLQIADRAHVPIDSAEVTIKSSFTWKSAKLKQAGLYYCQISIAGKTEERPFFYGDLESGYSRLSDLAKKFTATDESVTIDLQAQLGRLQHLLDPSSRSSEFWDQKVVASFAEVENGLALLRKGNRAYRRAAGTHLRGYRSPVDGQIQHYWIHVPESAQRSGKPMPLVIALPFITISDHPFLESYYLAAFDETERYRILGDDFGFAVLQVWGRGNHLGGTAISTADVFDALQAVQQDYDLDPDRIYLLGYCEAGRLALLLGERFPERFAAIATSAPITVVRGRRPFENRWIRYASPITAVSHLKSVPLLIRHDEADMTPPFQESVLFIARSREAGVDASFVPTEGNEHVFSQNPMGEKRALFEFFRGKKRHPATLKPVANHATQELGMGSGPIEDAFGAPVLIVEGTKGTAVQRAALHGLVKELGEEWQKAYFVDCPVKMDTEVRDSEISKYNLIVVGDEATNELARRMAGRLPLRLTDDGISLAGTSYQGRRLGYEFIAPNPLNPAKYVVMIGMKEWQPVNGWRLHPSHDGICDYFVFDLQGDRPRMKDAGYFDASVWQKPHPDTDK